MRENLTVAELTIEELRELRTGSRLQVVTSEHIGSFYNGRHFDGVHYT